MFIIISSHTNPNTERKRERAERGLIILVQTHIYTNRPRESGQRSDSPYTDSDRPRDN